MHVNMLLTNPLTDLKLMSINSFFKKKINIHVYSYEKNNIELPDNFKDLIIRDANSIMPYDENRVGLFKFYVCSQMGGYWVGTNIILLKDLELESELKSEIELKKENTENLFFNDENNKVSAHIFKCKPNVNYLRAYKRNTNILPKYIDDYNLNGFIQSNMILNINIIKSINDLQKILQFNTDNYTFLYINDGINNEQLEELRKYYFYKLSICINYDKFFDYDIKSFISSYFQYADEINIYTNIIDNNFNLLKLDDNRIKYYKYYNYSNSETIQSLLKSSYCDYLCDISSEILINEDINKFRYNIFSCNDIIFYLQTLLFFPPNKFINNFKKCFVVFNRKKIIEEFLNIDIELINNLLNEIPINNSELNIIDYWKIITRNNSSSKSNSNKSNNSKSNNSKYNKNLDEFNGDIVSFLLNYLKSNQNLIMQKNDIHPSVIMDHLSSMTVDNAINDFLKTIYKNEISFIITLKNRTKISVEYDGISLSTLEKYNIISSGLEKNIIISNNGTIRLELLINLLKSIINIQTSNDIFEIIIVDFNSTDYRLDLLLKIFDSDDVNKSNKFKSNKPNIKIINMNGPFNRGLGMNIGVSYSTKENIFFIDSDMLFTSHEIFDLFSKLDTDVFFPICFNLCDPYHQIGYWKSDSYKTCIIKKNKILKWDEFESYGLEDISYYKKYENIERMNVKGYYHQWHPTSIDFKNKYYNFSDTTRKKIFLNVKNEFPSYKTLISILFNCNLFYITNNYENNITDYLNIYISEFDSNNDNDIVKNNINSKIINIYLYNKFLSHSTNNDIIINMKIDKLTENVVTNLINIVKTRFMNKTIFINSNIDYDNNDNNDNNDDDNDNDDNNDNNKTKKQKLFEINKNKRIISNIRRRR